MCLPMKAAGKRTAMARALTTVNSLPVCGSSILICSVVLLMVLSQYFHTDKSDSCSSFIYF